MWTLSLLTFLNLFSLLPDFLVAVICYLFLFSFNPSVLSSSLLFFWYKKGFGFWKVCQSSFESHFSITTTYYYYYYYYCALPWSTVPTYFVEFVCVPTYSVSSSGHRLHGHHHEHFSLVCSIRSSGSNILCCHNYGLVRRRRPCISVYWSSQLFYSTSQTKSSISTWYGILEPKQRQFYGGTDGLPNRFIQYRCRWYHREPRKIQPEGPRDHHRRCESFCELTCSADGYHLFDGCFDRNNCGYHYAVSIYSLSYRYIYLIFIFIFLPLNISTFTYKYFYL